MRCAEEFPLLRQAIEKHPDTGLQVFYIGHQDRTEKLTKYARENGVPDYLYDPDDAVSRNFGITYGAGIVFIDRQGVVRARIPKPFSSSLIEAELKKIL